MSGGFFNFNNLKEVETTSCATHFKKLEMLLAWGHQASKQMYARRNSCGTPVGSQVIEFKWHSWSSSGENDVDILPMTLAKNIPNIVWHYWVIENNFMETVIYITFPPIIANDSDLPDRQYGFQPTPWRSL